MKSLIFLFLNFLYLFSSLKAFIPNWELRKAGIIINSYPYTYTTEEYSDILFFIHYLELSPRKMEKLNI